MNRRDFFTRIVGTAVAAVVLPKLDVLAASLPPIEAEAIGGPVWFGTFAAIHDEAWRLYQQHMNATPYPVHSAMIYARSRIGDRVGYDGAFVLKNQFSVMLDSSDPSRSLQPAIQALTRKVEWEGLDYYGLMDCNLPGTTYADRRGPLRMVVQYNVMDDLHLMRFDVLGGSSPAALSRASKARLRDRLRRYPMPRLNPNRLPD